MTEEFRQYLVFVICTTPVDESLILLNRLFNQKMISSQEKESLQKSVSSLMHTVSLPPFESIVGPNFGNNVQSLIVKRAPKIRSELVTLLNSNYLNDPEVVIQLEIFHKNSELDARLYVELIEKFHSLTSGRYIKKINNVPIR